MWDVEKAGVWIGYDSVSIQYALLNRASKIYIIALGCNDAQHRSPCNFAGNSNGNDNNDSHARNMHRKE